MTSCNDEPPRSVLFSVVIVVVLTACQSDGPAAPTVNSPPMQSADPASAVSAPEPPSWSFPDVVESAREVAPRSIEGRDFNQFGVAYPTSTLNAVPVSTLPAQELQKYADIVTHAYPDAVFRQMRATCNEMPIAQLNTTTWAGLAYVSLNAVNPATRKSAAKCLAELKARLNGEHPER